MAQQVPGQSDRDGMTLIQMMDMFPTDEVAARVRGMRLAWRRTQLRKVRQHQHPRGFERQAHVLLVHGLPLPLQRPDGSVDGAVQHPNSQVGHRHPPSPERPQVGVRHEAAPRPWHQPAKRVVRNAPHPGSVGMRRGRWPDRRPVEFGETCMGGKQRNKSSAKRKMAEGRVRST